VQDDDIKRSDSWYRRLKDGRIEINLVGRIITDSENLPLKVRASLPEGEVGRIIDFFEDVTGATVEWEGRSSPPNGPKPIPGQTTILEQLESQNGEEQSVPRG